MLIYSAAGNNQDYATDFQSTIFYKGDIVDFGLENGTRTGTLRWKASLNVPSDKPNIQNGDDFYTYYVLGQPLTTSSNASSSTTAAEATSLVTPAAATTDVTPAAAASTTLSGAATQTSDFLLSQSAEPWPNPAYPEHPEISQIFLGSGGVVTGYFLPDSQTAVLSIPSFGMSGDLLLQFSNTVHEFLNLSSQAGITKIVVDIQQNFGGKPLLTIDTFKQVSRHHIIFYVPSSSR